MSEGFSGSGIDSRQGDSLAQGSDLLLLGETHGTQEVPRLASELIPLLTSLGFGAIGLELPEDQSARLREWADRDRNELPDCFRNPTGDGRANDQVLELVEAAWSARWAVLCFAVGMLSLDRAASAEDLSDMNDAGMAANLTTQWKSICPGKKVLAICGSYHSRLAKMRGRLRNLRPSMAMRIQELNSEIRVNSLHIRFRRGRYFNFSVRSFHGWPIVRPRFESRPRFGHTARMDLPKASRATFQRK